MSYLEPIHRLFNPTTFSAVANGTVLLIVGLLLAVDIWSTNFYCDGICPSKVSLFPALVLVSSFVWFLYAIISSDHILAILKGQTNSSNHNSSSEQSPQDQQYRRPTGYFFIVLITSALTLWGSIRSFDGIGFCGSTLFIWPAIAFAFICITPGMILSGLFFFLTRKTILCFETRMLRLFWNNYLIALPMTFLWLVVPCSKSSYQEQQESTIQQLQLNNYQLHQDVESYSTLAPATNPAYEPSSHSSIYFTTSPQQSQYVQHIQHIQQQQPQQQQQQYPQMQNQQYSPQQHQQPQQTSPVQYTSYGTGPLV